MGTKLPAKDEALYQRIDEVLHYLWNPIGVAGTPEARDEYYSYLPSVFNRLKINEGAESIAKHLLEITVDRMGMQGNYKRDLEVAEILLHWKTMIESKA